MQKKQAVLCKLLL